MEFLSFSRDFPNSDIRPFLKTSEPTTSYNCIAWACGDNSKWYWPDKDNQCYWPDELPRKVHCDAFIQLFKSLGYDLCSNGDLEPDYEKIAIYLKNGAPTHAARQLPNGHWTSKLGQDIDVSHSIESMNGGMYGDALIFMARPNIGTVGTE